MGNTLKSKQVTADKNVNKLIEEIPLMDITQGVSDNMHGKGQSRSQSVTADKNENKLIEEKPLMDNTQEVSDIMPGNGQSKSQPKPEKNSSTRKAYMWTPQSTPLTCNFEKELQKKMKKNDLKSVDDVSKVEEGTPLILICNDVSRVGQDVDTSLQSIKDQKLDRVCIVALHVGMRGNVPSMKTADRLNDKQGYPIIDMAYCDKERMFDFSMNKKAYTQLKSFISNTDEVISSKDGNSDKNKGKKSAGTKSLLSHLLPKNWKKKDPWRKLEAGVQWNEEYKDKLLDQVQIAEQGQADVKNLEHINILLIGSDQAGKSSFFSIIADIAKASTDNEKRLYGEGELKIYTPAERLNTFKLYYTTCSNDLMDLQTEDILYMAKGNVLPDYKFNFESPIDKTHEQFKKDVEFKEMMHCVVYVMNADQVGTQNKIDPPLWKISDIQKIQTRMDELDIPTIIILTNAERLVHNNTTIHESGKVGHAVKLATEMFSVQEQNVFPVMNFTEEPKCETQILLLLALRQMLNFSVDFIKSQNQNENTESGSTLV